MKHPLYAGLLLSTLVLGCAPEFDVRNSHVDAERILAVVAEPAEARPGARVDFRALAAGPAGTLREPSIEYSYCTLAKPLTENDSVAGACASSPGAPLASSPAGEAIGTMPADACRIHGPDTAVADARPRDPDATGGYYQPVRLAAFGGVSYHLQRILCSPNDVAADVAREFAEYYTANENPGVPALRVFDASGELGSVASDSVAVKTQSQLTLSLTWSVEDREKYAYIDRTKQTVTQRTEALAVQWFTSAGSLERDRHVVDESDGASTAVTNHFTAPASSGTATLWAVLHDERGGSAVIERRLEIR